MLKRAVLWLRSNVMRRRYEREMRDQMEEHLERATHGARCGWMIARHRYVISA